MYEMIKTLERLSWISQLLDKGQGIRFEYECNPRFPYLPYKEDNEGYLATMIH